MTLRDFLKPFMLFAVVLATSMQVRAQVPLQAFLGVMNTNPTAAKASLGRIRDGWRDAYTAPLIELVAFVPVLSVQTEVLAQLEKVTGLRSGGDLNPLYEWLWARPPGEHPDYAQFKAQLYIRGDRLFADYFPGTATFAIRPDEDAMTRLFMPPIDAVLPCQGLKLGELPVQRIAPHRLQRLCRCVHGANDTAGNINLQSCEARVAPTTP